MTEPTPPSAQDICLISKDSRLSQRLSSALNNRSIYIPPANVSAEKILELIPTMQPTLVVVDLSFQDDRGLGLIRRLTRRQSSPLILAVGPARVDREAHARRALIAGATGYLSDDEVPEEAERAVQRMNAGNIFLSEQTKDRLYSPVAVNG